MTDDDRNVEEPDEHGTPVERVSPVERVCAELIGSMKEKVRVKGDVFSVGI